MPNLRKIGQTVSEIWDFEILTSAKQYVLDNQSPCSVHSITFDFKLEHSFTLMTLDSGVAQFTLHESNFTLLKYSVFHIEIIDFLMHSLGLLRFLVEAHLGRNPLVCETGVGIHWL